jgi:AraC-like DNA-binding protein
MHGAYRPFQPGIPRRFADAVRYREAAPADTGLRDTVFCLWILETLRPLPEPFTYLVLPDCCIDVVLDMSQGADAPLLAMTPGTHAIPLQLGREFRYAGVRFLPGAWQSRDGIPSARDIVTSPDPYELHILELEEVARQGANLDDAALFAQLEEGFVRFRSRSPGIPSAIPALLNGTTVRDAARTAGYSTRQLSRIVRERTGFTPRDLIRIGKMHRVIRDVSSDDYLDEYYDQPHFIREFKRITGYTPAEFRDTF